MPDPGDSGDHACLGNVVFVKILNKSGNSSTIELYMQQSILVYNSSAFPNIYICTISYIITFVTDFKMAKLIPKLTLE